MWSKGIGPEGPPTRAGLRRKGGCYDTGCHKAGD
ncbi:DUF6053 domain-containing protein [Lysobacter enzymogenes]